MTTRERTATWISNGVIGIGIGCVCIIVVLAASFITGFAVHAVVRAFLHGWAAS